MTDYVLNKVFSLPSVFGIAIICGKISRNLEVIDVDQKNDLEGKLGNRFIDAIINYSPVLYSRLVIAATRNNGYHFFYRCNEIACSGPLARRSCTDYEISRNPKQVVKVLAETIGEASYIIVPPTPGYRFLQHNLEQIPVIEPSERAALLDIARTFNKYEQPELIRATNNKFYGEESPFNDYNMRGDIISLLERHGWKAVRTTSLKTYFQRPGNTDHETSGDFHHELRLFGVFTTSTEFIPGKGYQPAAVYAILECHGDFRLAAKRLVQEGYGIAYKQMY